MYPVRKSLLRPLEDFSAICEHNDVKRAMEVSAADSHHLLMLSPGCGKILLAHAFNSIVPDIIHEYMLEMYSIYQQTTQTRGYSLRPPKRAPHHTYSSDGAIQGGGRYPKPGELLLMQRQTILTVEKRSKGANYYHDFLNQENSHFSL